MVQTLLVYLIVALAAGWTLWSFGLRGWLRRRRAGRRATNGPTGGCGDNCGCAD
jgi:hypothetical protein